MRGHNPEWDHLPRRKCDDCGKSYKPKQPLKKDQRGFCSDNCRKSYHKHGGAYRKLKGELEKLVSRRVLEIKAELYTRVFDIVREELQRTAQDVAPVTSPLPKEPASFRASR